MASTFTRVHFTLLRFLLSVCWLLGAPAVAHAASCGMGNKCPVVTSLTVSASPAPAGKAVTVTCAANDSDGVITKFSFTATSGTFLSNTANIDATPAVSQASATADVVWTAPATGGTATISCLAWDSGGMLGKPTAGDPVTINVAVVAGDPPTVSLTAAANAAYAGETLNLSVIAASPQGKKVTIELTASDGTVTQPNAAGLATWKAPAAAGSAVITAKATDADGLVATAILQLSVVLAKANGFIKPPVATLYPERLAADAAGTVFVTDPRARTVSRFTVAGAPLGAWAFAGQPSGIALAPSGALYVGDVEHGRVAITSQAGVVQGELGQAGSFGAPVDIAVDSATGRVHVADSQKGTVRRFEATGAELPALDMAGGSPAGVAVLPGGAAVYVSDSAQGKVRVFGPDGALLKTIGTFGAKAGSLTRPAGIAVTATGRLFVVDAFQSTVVTFDSSGIFEGSIGSWGQTAGLLNLPVDVALDPFGRLLVTSAENGRLEAYTLPGVQPLVCVGDADCDGMPDVWELANGLNPADPSDAAADSDGDGLNNLAEYQLGTQPKVADSDGDGVSDGVEHSKGTNPLDGKDNAPLATIQVAAQVEPSRLVLDGSGSWDPNQDPLTWQWSSLAAPLPVVLNDTAATAPWTVVRAAGSYTFGLTVSDGKASSGAVQASVAVLNVAPTADAGPEQSALVGATVALDGRFSSDANGDALTYKWQQLAGPTTALTGSGPKVTFVPTKPGVYEFSAIVADGGVATVQAKARVVVGESGNTVPVAAIATPAQGKVGLPVALDGSASVDLETKAIGYQWQQVAGPAVVLQDAATANPSFTPTQPAAYEFELTVTDGSFVSPPARAIVLVDDDSNGPARAVATPLVAGSVLTPIPLDGSASFALSGQPPACLWTQVEGLHVPIAAATSCAASFVPIDPGTYVFELQVSSSASLGSKVRVVAVVDQPGVDSVPIVKTEGSADSVQVGQSVALSAAASLDPDGSALNFAWTQVQGPRVTLGDSHAPTLDFVIPAPGLYAFEVRADDGKLRSAPSVVTVYATSPTGSDTGDAGGADAGASDADAGSSEDAADAAQVDAAPVDAVQTDAVQADSAQTDAAQGDTNSADAAADASDDAQLQADTDTKAPTPPATSGGSSSSGGCTAGTTSMGSSLWLALIALAAVLGLRRRRPSSLRVVAGLLGMALAAGLVPSAAQASDGPHNVANLANLCEDCHLGHNTLGTTLTSNASNQNLCLNCHTLKGLNWSGTDQAVPGVSGTSHRWDAALNNAAYGATAPTDPTIAKHLGTGGTTLLCSACHDQHSQALAPADPFAPAAAGTSGRHFMRMANNSSQMCLACHSARNIQDATTYTGGKLSHPVGVGIPISTTFSSPPADVNGTAQMAAKAGTATAGTTTTLTDTAGALTGLAGKWVRFTSGANKNTTRLIASATATQITWAATLPSAIVVGVTYRIDNDGNASNNLVLDNAGTPSFTAGNVMCLTCHAVHYADSNSATLDGAPGGTGDGMLLRRTNDDTTCTGCHKVKMHNSANTSTQYGTWGATFTCRTCHDTHDSKNIYLVRESVATPNSGAKVVDFRNLTGKADFSFATATAPGNGICEVCHTMTKNSDGTPRFRNAGGGDGGKHYAGNCLTCHSHADGFKPGESSGNTDCLSCHAFGMDTAAATRTATYHHVVETGANLTAGITTYTTSATPTLATADKDKACVQCHADHNVFRPDLNTLNTVGRGASLRSRIASGPPTGNPAGTAAPGDTAPGFYTNKEYDATFAGKGLCLNCHATAQNKNSTDQMADGTTVTPAINAATYATSRHTYTVPGQYTTGNGAFTVDCVKCHSDSSTALQNGTNKFELHTSVDRSLRNPLGQTAQHDASEEDFCFRCHSKTSDLTPGGGPAKTVGLKDYYNVATMSAASEAVFGQFQYGRTSTTTTTTNQLYFKPVAAEAATEPMPAAQSTDAVVSTVSSNTLYLRSATDGPSVDGVMPAAWQLASGTYSGTTTLQQRSMMPTAGTTQETISQSTITTSSRYYRLAQFLSPPIATSATIAAGASMTLNVRVQESSTSMNLMIRYALYRWTAANALGTTLEPVAQYVTEVPSTASNVAITFATNTAATFAVGDKLFLEVEYFTNAPTAAGTASFFFGNATSNASLVLPAALSFTTTTGGPIGGTWVARSMSAGTTAIANETQSATAVAVPGGTSKWRRVTFVSPAVAATTAIAAGNWTITINAYNSNAAAKARVRYRLAGWNANDTEGTVITNWTSDTQTWGTANPGTPLSITFAGAAATLTAGDALILDMEIETNTVATAGSYTIAYVFGATAAGNLLMPTTLGFSKTTSTAGYSHGIYSYSGRHRASSTDETLAYLAANKHVECEDCHNPHAATAGVHALKTNLVSGTLTGVSGAVATWATTTNWSAASSYTLGTATKEYEICFKCHSGANTSLATWNATWTNVAQDFSPKNRSIHPVTVSLNDASRTNALAPKPLIASQMVAAWNSVGTQTMYCTDCHGEGVASPAAQGPHGSAVAFMLKGANTSWPNNSSGTLAKFSAMTGLFCLNCHVTGSASNGVHSKGDHSGAACVNCHLLVPHGGGMSRLLGDSDSANMPTRLVYQGNKANIWLSGFTKAATPTGYSKSNCSSAASGCTTHSGTMTENW